jgi:CheY-like chemotaxis protein
MPLPINILLVDDDPGDVMLTRKALESEKVFNSLHAVGDGVEAMKFLRQQDNYSDAPRPDLILLDLNMPRKDGRETLAEIKADENLKRIPVVILTTSDAEQDIAQSYDLQASCFVTKPVNLGQFVDVVRAINGFWLCVVKFPPKESVCQV